MLKRKKPLVQINPASTNSNSKRIANDHLRADHEEIRSFSCLYRKPQSKSKKHKSWDGDGKIEVYQGNWKLLSEQGRELGQGKNLSQDLLQGNQLFLLAGKECEIQSEILNPTATRPVPLAVTVSSTTSSDNSSFQYFKGYYRKPSNKMHKTWDGDMFLKIEAEGTWILLGGEKGEELGRAQKPATLVPDIGVGFKMCGKELELASGPIPHKEFERLISVVAMPSFHAAPKPMIPFKPFKSTVVSSTAKTTIAPKFKPEKANALLMPKLSSDLVQVVVDPFISCKLKPFQREGVVFLYETLMGHKSTDYRGAILADEMGLGKSLQTIALLWTLLKQSPISRNSVAKRAVIVAPATLLNNWSKEFKKWLGDTRIKTLIVNNDTISTDFMQFHQILIINYEKVKKFKAELARSSYDIIVCDEGHRLKNASNQAFQILQDLPCKRRIILTGTPLQNYLLEFFQMIDFVNPGLLGTLAEFRKTYATPIELARTSDSLESVNEKGREKLDELLFFVSPFMLRRLATENEQFLPPKQEFVVFNRLSKSQAARYKLEAEDLIHQNDALSKITNLRQICNGDSAEFEDSSKFVAIGELLKEIKIISEKVAIVSHWTKNLDAFEGFLAKQQLQFRRLDGSVAATKRQILVDEFNRNDAIFAFLLSSKAGGAGLNLIGASRLIMVDIDWNPAIDQQAMARIWRHGQKLPVFIYRFFASGTIEEHIYQRQGFKKQLFDSVMDQSGDNFTEIKFNTEELRKIMGYHPQCDSHTHDMICSSKAGCGVKEHLCRPFGTKLEDQFDDVALSAVVKRVESISFVLACDEFS